MKRDKPPRGINKICALLGTERFTPFAASGIRRYFHRRSGLTERQRQQIAELRHAFGQIMAKLGPGERLIVGKFIGLKKKEGLDFGLRAGLSARIAPHEDSVGEER